MSAIPTYAEFCAGQPQAAGLISALCDELGRQDQCATLNPAVGYCLRQVGLGTIIITGEVRCPGAPIELMEAGFHLWNLVRDGDACWHVDFANHFLTAGWYRDTLPEQVWYRVARGQEPGPPIPLQPQTMVWGLLRDRGIQLRQDSVCARAPFFDVLSQAGKRDAVRQLFREHGLVDPYDFHDCLLDLRECAVPP